MNARSCSLNAENVRLDFMRFSSRLVFRNSRSRMSGEAQGMSSGKPLATGA